MRERVLRRELAEPVVRRDLRRIFDYRHDAIAERIGAQRQRRGERDE